MYTFLISILLLVIGYLTYGKFVERVFGADPKRPTPAIANPDGVDYVPMPAWKVYMIQFLNIAGTGPIFGAIMGAMFGPSAYLWIVFGCIFAGAVHDYLTGMLSVRNNGANIPGLVGKYMGEGARKAVMLFTVVVLMLVGVVFVYSPALILGGLTGGGKTMIMVWIGAIFLYYVLATLLPIDKIIGKIYPFFAFAILFMAIALSVCLFIKWPSLPEVWNGLGNLGVAKGLHHYPIFPAMFITIACGAVSGFHASQSPLMARCLKNEKKGRPIFYGSMITEGVVALIWATVASWFFYGDGAATLGMTVNAQAPEIVVGVAKGWLGILGGILAIIGVVAAPITSGDTAFRSMRLTIAEFFNIKQEKIAKRLAISIPLFAFAALVLWFNIAKPDGFNIIWRYFGWANQTLAVIMLWVCTIYLAKAKKGLAYLIALIPALFMTTITSAYIATAKIGFNLPQAWSWYAGRGTALTLLIWFLIWKYRKK